MDILGFITRTVDYIGYLGPFLLLSATIILLRTKATLLSVYVVGYVLNLIINIILKELIKQPRPSEDLSIFNASVAHGKRISFDRYGMPSGHATSVFYSTVFIFLALKSPVISIIYLLLAINTGYQRIKYKNHTLTQVICGAIIGTIAAYLAYLYATKKLAGLLRYKKDDNAPI
uniref:Phosphatidic acid phosphatase type 2/haloperoxidase domain-containing protein n=1 Tax=viral metagenome TaxID=1070528 RepID=A0A6C0HR97_9ZZZZ